MSMRNDTANHPAELLTQRLSAANVSTYFQRSSDVPTITKLRVMSRNQQLLRLDFEQRLDSVDTSALLAQVEQAQWTVLLTQV